MKGCICCGSRTAGLFSNDFIFHVTGTAAEAVELQASIDADHVDRRSALNEAASKGNIDQMRR